MKKVISYILLVLVSTMLHAQEKLSLQQAVSIGLEKNLNIKISEKAVEQTTNDYEKSVGAFLPQVSITAGKSFSNTNVRQQFVNDDSPREINGAKSNTLDVSPNLRWTIFNGLGMFHTRDRIAETMGLAEDDLKIQIENTIAQISTAYYRLVLEKERLRVLEEALKLSADRVELAKTRYEVGKTSKLDYLQAQVDYNADQSNVLNQKEVVFNAQVDLNRLMGTGLDAQYETDANFSANESLQIESLLASAQLNNPGLLRAQRNREIAYLQSKEIGAERFPQLSLNFGYNFNDRNSDAGFLISNTSKGINYGITASWNILNGFDVKRRMQNAQIQIETRELEIENMKLQLESDLRKAFINYQNSIALRALEEQNFSIAEENYDIALERYKLGNATPLEIREAQINFVQAELRKIQASFSVKVQEIELNRLAGNNLQ
ncbi:MULTISPECIES: TolC family protein [Roseivirga]|jgi:outer membrane protein TolC|uniref:Membrane protein n=1 Tax=Roseivirga thermotolerans TaxID=1758176 RepID=A0ABQ3I5X5_9BACT|nr:MULTISPECIES: TolC family protein [Roseivirga]GHE57181.1 membrane protein [Roseivirga thermotolerans]|tara:strand:- start:43084 stop:44388 length:1305 start_codon:yes stop_codon:yes gene_type:complete